MIHFFKKLTIHFFKFCLQMSRQQKSNNKILQQLSEEQEKRRYAEEQLSIKTIRITELETENQRLHAEANQWQEQSSRINDYQIMVNEQRERKNQLTNQSNEVQCQNRRLTDEKTLLQQNIDSLTQRIRELETENQRLQADANQWHQRADDLQRTIDEQSSRINDYQIMVNEQRERLNQLTNQSNEVQCQNRRLTDEKTLLQQNIDSLTQRIRELETENQRLQADAYQWHQRADDLQRTIDEQSSRINDFQGTVSWQRERINDLTDERTLLQQNTDSLTQRIRELEINSPLSRQRSFNGQTPDWILNREEIIVSEQGLGVGGWGSVKTGKFRGISVAVKQIHELILSPHNRVLFEREMTIASQCRHPCLLQFIGATNDDDSPLFVTEVLETDLRTLMSQRPLEENEILRLCHDISCALNYLHMMHPVPIIHRDLSSSNILLWHEGSRLRAKISDYGAANFMMDTMTQNPGAVLYSAPEAGTPQQSTKVGKYHKNYLKHYFTALCKLCDEVVTFGESNQLLWNIYFDSELAEKPNAVV